MIEGFDIICFANDWNGDPLSKKHLMRRLAQRNRILWINSIGNRRPQASVRDARRVVAKVAAFARGPREVLRNINVFSPLVIPYHGSRAVRAVNGALLRWQIRHQCRRLRFGRRLTYTFLPSSSEVAGNLGEEAVVYHITDDFSQFTGTDSEAILQMEQRLIAKSDAVIASAEPLRRTRPRAEKIRLVTHGVEVAHFRKACAGPSVPEDLARIPRPIVGFFGLIADWVDLKLVREIALARPVWNVVLIGKTETTSTPIAGLPNVHLLGQKSYESLPAYAAGFDAAILPFVLNPLTIASNPLKLREYLAAGLPVVSTDIPEARRLSGRHVRVARGAADFLARLDEIVESGDTGPSIARSRSMDGESWDSKVEEISEIILAALPEPRAAQRQGSSRSGVALERQG